MENVTLKGLHTNVLFELVENPYKAVTTESGIYLPNGSYKSQETGQLENDLQQIIQTGKVYSVGPDCKYLQPGDLIYVDTRSCRPVPFKRMKLLILNEQNVLCKAVEE